MGRCQTNGRRPRRQRACPRPATCAKAPPRPMHASAVVRRLAERVAPSSWRSKPVAPERLSAGNPSHQSCTRHVADVPRVADDQFEMPLQHGIDRAPVDPGSPSQHTTGALNDRLHHDLLPSEGDHDTVGTFETLPFVLPVPEGDKEWCLYAARVGLLFGVETGGRTDQHEPARCGDAGASASGWPVDRVWAGARSGLMRRSGILCALARGRVTIFGQAPAASFLPAVRCLEKCSRP